MPLKFLDFLFLILNGFPVLVDFFPGNTLPHCRCRIRVILYQPHVMLALQNIQFRLRGTDLVIDGGKLFSPVRFTLLIAFVPTAGWFRSGGGLLSTLSL